MSELALGWATYNGDHMSMYAVNCSVPKTLVRYLVLYYAETTDNKKLSEVLMDVLDTPVSPELLPPVDGVISQKTEDLVGPYELHDFFLYYMLRFGFPKAKLYRMAKLTFDGVYDAHTIVLICHIHQNLCSFSCLRVFISYIMVIFIMPDICKMLADCFFDSYFFECRS